MSDRICGALSCTNDAVGTVPKDGRVVWVCPEHGGQEIKGESSQ